MEHHGSELVCGLLAASAQAMERGLSSQDMSARVTLPLGPRLTLQPTVDVGCRLAPRQLLPRDNVHAVRAYHSSLDRYVCSCGAVRRGMPC